MRKLYQCSMCRKIVRRPIDHTECAGSRDGNLYLVELKKKPSETEITQEINLREMGFVK